MLDHLPFDPRARSHVLLAVMLEIEREEGRWEDDGGAAVGEGQETSDRLLLPYHADAVRIQAELDGWWLTRRALEFERWYAANSGMTVAELRAHQIVVPCACGDDICEGFACWPIGLLADLKTMRRVPADWSWPP